jgi:hypothetical protein
VRVKVAVVAPAGMVTVAGTVPAAVALEESVIAKPPVGAGLETVTVPVDAVPPITEVGFIVRPLSTGALMVNAAVPVEP